MKGIVDMKVATLVGLLGLALVAAPAIAAGQQQQQTPPQQAAPPEQQKPATPPPAAKPAPKPFPEGARIAFVDIQRIANESRDGQAATKKVQDLEQRKLAELGEKNKALQAAQEKLNTGGNVMSDDARARLSKDIERQQVDIQRAQQDASTEVEEMRQQLQLDFQRKLVPVLQQVAQEKNLHFLFAAEAGIVWADPGLDLTSEIIQKFDAAAAGS
ncbi:MAG: OmpH family outer membrane protein, partial [Acidobacteria bacterium]